jgi:TolB-like protein/Tfp pilus assembly protein PilF
MTQDQDLTGHEGGVPAEFVREQFARMLRSRVFGQAPMLSRLLKYLVERTIESDTGQLKEYAVGVEVFDRGSSFDPRTDTIVRVQARRLRSKLQDYYRGEGRTDPIVVELPTGRYAVRCRPADAGREIGDASPGPDAPESSGRPSGAPVAASDVPAGEAPSIVVLPFANLSGDAGNDYFSDGLTEEIIGGLAAVPELRVVARTSAFQFKGRADDVRRIGRDLGVQTLLEGSVRKDGSRIRVTAQLVSVSDGFHLWSRSYDRELTGVFSIQEEITDAIVSALRIRLGSKDGTGRTRVPEAPTPEAYEWYLKGRYFYHKVTPAAFEKSAECMERAISCDPGYAAAHAGLSDVLVTSTSVAAGRPPSELLAKARQSAQIALELDGESAEARCSLAEVLAVADWDFHGAEREYRTALDLKPSFVHARVVYSVTCLSPLRRHDDAIEQLRRALTSDPMSVLLRTMLGQGFVLADRPDQGIGELHRALELEPGYVFAHYTLAFAYLAKSLYTDALDVLLRMPDAGAIANYAGHLGYTRARLGDRAEAELLLHQLLQRPWVPGVDVAAIYNGLGDTDRAVEWLTRARQAREFDSLFVRDDPRFRNLLADPRLVRAFDT